MRHRLLSQVPDPAGKQVDIAFDDAGDGTTSFDEICTLAGALRQLIAQSRALDGLDFVTASGEALRGIDIGELEARVAEATAAFDGALSYLAQAVRDDDARQQARMLLMAAFDLPGAVPILGGAISLLQQAEGLLARAEKRRDALERIEDGTTDGERIAAPRLVWGRSLAKRIRPCPCSRPWTRAPSQQRSAARAQTMRRWRDGWRGSGWCSAAPEPCTRRLSSRTR